MGEDAAIITTADKASTIKTISDLRGKKVATIRLATGDAVFRGALDEAGLNWKTDLEIFELKSPPAVLEAVKSGQADAGVTWGPHDLRAEEEGLKVVIRSRSLQPGHPCCRLIINGKDVQNRPDVWIRLNRAMLRAEEFAQNNHEKTLDDISKYLKLDRALLAKAYYSGYLDQSSDPNVAGVQRFWKTMNKSGFVESNLDVGQCIETKFYKTALDQLAKENPNNPFWKQRQQVFAERDVAKTSVSASEGQVLATGSVPEPQSQKAHD
jgi:NitT/TauT family transport system substrate-binding protein